MSDIDYYFDEIVPKILDEAEMSVSFPENPKGKAIFPFIRVGFQLDK